MLAIIPARGGSKGLPGKNVRNLCGKPMIAYAIEAALGASCVDKVVVSTEDVEIAAVSKEYGAEVPFMRPGNLASDTASAIDVYIHATEYMHEHFNMDVSKFMVLLPTAPFRTAEHIEQAYDKFLKCNAKTLVSVTDPETPPGWYMTINDNGMIRNAGFEKKESIISNRQNSEKYFIPNGAIYILDYDLLKKERTYYCESTAYYYMNKRQSVDIDTLDDFKYAEYLLKERMGIIQS